MQQRFSKNEMKRYQITTVVTANDLKLHPWVQVEKELKPTDSAQIRKKKSQFLLNNDGNVQVLLSLKELLNVSSDWNDVKSKGIGVNSTSGAMGTKEGAGNVPVDFQQTQIERIIDALSLALPTRMN